MAMPRIEPPEDSLPDDVAAVLERQRGRYGSELYNHLVLARRPSIFRGFRAMWDGIDASGKLAPALLSLIYLRVAMLVGCGL